MNLASTLPGHLIPNSAPNFLIVLRDIGLIESVALRVIDINRLNLWMKSFIISCLVSEIGGAFGFFIITFLEHYFNYSSFFCC